MTPSTITKNETVNPAQGLIYNAALGIGALVQNCGLGAQIANSTIGFFFYTRMIAAAPIQNNLTHYICANVASRMASRVVSSTFLGVSLGTLANVAVTAIAVIAVAKALQLGYNHFINENEKDKVTIGLGSLAARAVLPVSVPQVAAPAA